MALLEGFLIGLATIVFFGAVFFTLLNATLQFGFKSGIWVTLGVFVSDIIALILCFVGAGPYLSSNQAKFWLALVGGTAILLMGAKYLIKPIKIMNEQVEFKSTHYINLFIKGFAVNFLNPFTFMYWIGVVGYSESNYVKHFDVYGFMAACILGIFVIDIFKVIMAKQIKNFLKPRLLANISKISGIILILIGLRLLWTTV